MSRKVFSMLIVVVVLCSAFITAQYRGGSKADSYLTSYTYLDFEGNPNDEFDVKMSMFGISNEMKSYKTTTPVGMGEVRASSTNFMGIVAKFKRRANNWIEISPKPGVGNAFKGKVKRISCWVWGPNVAYQLDYILEDFEGYYWTLPVTTLDYKGWKNLHTIVPGTIPQDAAQIPAQKRGLKFKKFRISATPKLSYEFFLFFDTFKVVADTYKGLYDGWQLEEQLNNQTD